MGSERYAKFLKEFGPRVTERLEQLEKAADNPPIWGGQKSYDSSRMDMSCKKQPGSGRNAVFAILFAGDAESTDNRRAPMMMMIDATEGTTLSISS